MDDDLLPNDGSLFDPMAEPVEQAVERKKEKAKTLEALPIINEVIQHFQERIDYQDKLSSIQVDISADPALHQKAFEVKRLLRKALAEEKQLLEDLLEVAMPKRR